MSVYHMHVHKRVLDPLELELQTVMNCHVHAEISLKLQENLKQWFLVICIVCGIGGWVQSLYM